MTYSGHFGDPAVGRWPTDRTIGWATRFFDTALNDDVDATVECGATGISIFNTDHKLMAEWQYRDIAHAFEPVQRLEYVLIVPDQPSEQLTIGDRDLYKTLLTRAPQLRRKALLLDRIGSAIGAFIVYGALGITALSAILWLVRRGMN